MNSAPNTPGPKSAIDVPFHFQPPFFSTHR
jgi:hypothetical protein